ncbi:lipopolysaccharide biosynthesis protein [Lentisalinibacter salinarum]|uniref:lipopolysaccharide biosynthesis protein n=1 Tax=Lentisalinibacter salinarum TaxID=2992239 RepID=UPI003865AEB4
MEKVSLSIGRRIASGAFWTVGMRLSIRALGVISGIILARLLVPEDFGIVAKASMIASFLELITTFGLEVALIQNQRAVAGHYNTVWTIHAIRGLFIALLLVAFAGPAASFFHEPALFSILWFYALAALLNGFENVGVVDFRKELEFDRDFRFSLYRKLAGFVVTIAIAYVWRTYWAFVIGTVFASMTALVSSFLMSPYRPRFSLVEWRSLFQFSKWIFLVGLVRSVSQKLDTFILSRFSTTDVVGRYTVAYEIAGAASTEIAMPIARATLPGLAKLNESLDEFRDMYRRSIAVLLLLAVPAGLGLSAVAVPLTDVVLGDKWSEAAPIIQILAIYGVVRSVFAVSTSAFMSSGQVRTLGLLSLFNLTIRVIGLGAGFAINGLLGLAAGVLIAGTVQMIVSLFVQQFVGLLGVAQLANDTWRLIFAGLVMYAGLVYGLPLIGPLEGLSGILLLGIQVLVGAFVYLLLVGLLWWLTGRGEGPEQTVWNYVASGPVAPSTGQ